MSRRFFSIASLSSAVFALAVGSAAANDLDTDRSSEKELSFSCDAKHLTNMSEADRLNYMFSSVVVIQGMTKFKMRQHRSGMMVPTPPQPTSGGGVIVDRRGYITTNHHVVDDHEPLFVRFYDETARNGVGQKIPAKIVGSDERTDVAVLKIDTTMSLNCVDFGDSTKVSPLQPVIAIGHPFGQYYTVTQGIVSHSNRFRRNNDFTNFVQTDAALNQGNSGGALFSLMGQVVGINESIFSPAPGPYKANAGINFAIQANTVSAVVDELIRYGEIREGWSGLGVAGLDESTAKKLGNRNGVVVKATISEGPADVAGLKIGDIILEANGTVVRDPVDLLRTSVHSDPGDNIHFLVIRGDEKIEISMTLDDKNAFEQRMAARAKAAEMATAAPAVIEPVGTLRAGMAGP